MFTRRLAASIATVSFLAMGCGGQHTSLSRAQESATELNTNARFGRLQLASEYVSPKEKKGFFERHASWGNHIRVLDTEMLAMDVVPDGPKSEKKGDTVVVTVKVAWTFMDDQDLRVSLVSQKWKENGEAWHMIKEERVEGDPGLFGDKVIVVSPEQHSKQFATIHID